MYGRKRNTKTSEVTTVKARCSDCKYGTLASFSHTVTYDDLEDFGVGHE